MKNLPKLVKVISYWLLVAAFLFFAAASLHPIKAQEENASFIPVNDLKIGDWVFIKGDEEKLIPERIIKLEWIEGPIEVYNLTVEGDQTFFANGFAVHNKGEQYGTLIGRVWVDTNGNCAFDESQANSIQRSDNICDAYYYTLDGVTVSWSGPKEGSIAVNSHCGSETPPEPYYAQTVQTGDYTVQVNPPAGWIACPSQTVTVNEGDNHAWFGIRPATPKTCSLSLSSSSVDYPDSVTVDLSGNAYSSGSEIVTLWAERQDSAQITPAPGNEYYQAYSGKYYYNIGQCTTINSNPCSSSTTLSLPVGNYYFHCDIATDPGKCSGNPFCLYEGCTSNCIDCAGWVSCSGSDNSVFTVTSVPTCTISGSGTIVLGESGLWSATATVPGGGDANVEIDRNTSQSVIGLNQIAYSDCGSTANSCTVVGSWTPVAIGTYYVFCRGYNDALRECRPFGPYVYPADVDCGPNDWLEVTVTAPPAWFQTQGGDVHSGGSINSEIPDTCVTPGCDPNFSLPGDGGYPGVVSYNGSSADFSPGGSVSSPPAEWLAKTSFSKKSYNYFYQLLGSPTLETPPPEIRNVDLPSGDGIKAYNDNIQTGNTWQIGTRKIVILTSGKFLIKHRIVIDPGGSLVVIAQGGIGIFKNLIATGAGGNRLQGIFITDGTFYSSVEEDFTTWTPAESEKILVIDGGVIAQSVNLGRDFSGSLEYDNNTTPAETFRYDPSLFMNIHPDLWKSAFTWEELAP